MADNLGAEYEINDRVSYLVAQIKKGYQIIARYIDTGQGKSPLADAVKAQVADYQAELDTLIAKPVDSDAKVFLVGATNESDKV